MERFATTRVCVSTAARTGFFLIFIFHDYLSQLMSFRYLADNLYLRPLFEGSIILKKPFSTQLAQSAALVRGLNPNSSAICRLVTISNSWNNSRALRCLGSSFL